MKIIPQIRQMWVFALCISAPGPAVMAQSASVIGTWCEIGGGEILYLEENGIGFNEHTLCIGADPVMPMQSYQTVLSCKNVFFVDGETVEAFAQSRGFSADLSPQDQLQVTLDNQLAPRAFSRCAP